MRPGTSFRLFLLVGLVAGTFSNTYSQAAKKPAPIVFAGVFGGPAWGNMDYLLGAEMNYQVKRHLFSLRYAYAEEEHKYSTSDLERKRLHELALLYGWRLIDKNTSYSFSLGASYNRYKESYQRSYQTSRKTSRYFGVPFEASALLFKARPRPFRLLGLIPVGKPTAFGGSIGIKVVGNFSQHSYSGAGITYGLGWHKQYETR